MSGAELIAIERARQQSEEGYDAAHDAGHTDELAQAASCYAVADEWRRKLREVGFNPDGFVPDDWPWAPIYWKPTPDDRIRELVKAGALIAAAIDSLLADPSR